MMRHCTSKRLRSVITGYIAVWAALVAYPAVVRAEPGTSQIPVIECRGSVKPRHEWSLRLRPGEQVLNMRVADGDEVKVGDPLAEVLDGEAWARLVELQSQRRARFELKSKEVRLDRLESELKAQLQLWKEVEPDSAERRVAALREKRDELKEQVELLRLQVADPAGSNETKRLLAIALDTQISGLEAQLASPVLRAPFDGRVVYCASYPARRSVGETVLEVWDTNVIVRAEILQHQLAHVAKGCHAEISLDFSSEKPVRATVSRIEAQPDMQPGETYPTFGVELLLDEAPAWFKPGMRVSVHIHQAMPQNNPIRP